MPRSSGSRRQALRVALEIDASVSGMKVRDALTEKEERDGDFCRCGAPALDDSPHCGDCGSYWEECDKGLWDDPIEWNKE